jgi:HEXXH motif-containing protein
MIDSTKRYCSDLYAAHWLLVEGIGAKDVQRVRHGLMTAEKLLESPYAPNKVRIRTLNSSVSDGSILSFLESSEGGRGPNGEIPEMERLESLELKTIAPMIRDAISTIRECDAGVGDELREYVSEIRPFQGKVVRGITSVRAFGAVYIRVPEPSISPEGRLLYFVDHLTHETSHLHLHAIMNVDPLILNDDSKRFSAPIRKDLRPLYGIYHATFVLSRIARVLSRWHERACAAHILSALDEVRARYEKGYTTISENGSLTPMGLRVLENTRKLVECS